jgi:4,5-DOPA dioxygenase extradiol
VRAAVLADAADRLVDYRRLAPHAERAHPTEEHFLPLLVAIGANGGASAVRLIEDEVTYGMLSMESYVWGMTTGG